MNFVILGYLFQVCVGDNIAVMAKKEHKFINEFKNFIMRGNVVDMAVGIVVGGSFTAIVNSFVTDIINPIIGYLIGNVDLSNLSVVLPSILEGMEPVEIRYGLLIQKIVIFLITAFVLFLVIKGINKLKDDAEKKLEKLKKTEEEKTPEPVAAPEPVKSDETVLLEEIRDLLKKNA